MKVDERMRERKEGGGGREQIGWNAIGGGRESEVLVLVQLFSVAQGCSNLRMIMVENKKNLLGSPSCSA